MPHPSRDGNGVAADGAGADSRLSLLRELGEQAVLETIFRTGPITRPEIAAATNLSKPTVSAAVSRDRKSTRLNSSHTVISYAVFCLKKKKKRRKARTAIYWRRSRQSPRHS